MAISTAMPVWAVEIDEATTSPVSTSTADNGAAGDVTITEDGEIDISGSEGSSAVTADTDNDITNEGNILAEDTDSVIGINVTSGRVTNLAHAGTIELIEDYDREDEDDDDDLDGPLAIGTDRIGINVEAGSAIAGQIRLGYGSSILVEGNASAGILVGSALDGSYAQDGTILVTGDDAIGVQFSDEVTGDILVSGSVYATGRNARALTVQDGAGGTLTIESTVSSTGFTSTGSSNYIAPLYVDEDTEDVEDRLDTDDLYDNTHGVYVGGSLDGGLLINGAVDDFVSDEDEEDETKDTIDDFDENRSIGRIYSYGSGAALRIEATAGETVTLSPAAETVRDTLDDDEDEDLDEVLATFTYTQGLINRGTIFASGVNIGFDATALSLEGVNGGSVVVDGGILNTGTIQATAFEAEALALDIGTGTDIGLLENTGSITAATHTLTDDRAVAVQVADGGVLSTVRNNGTIRATSSGYSGLAIGVLDLSDTISVIENTGNITGSLLSDGREDTGLGSAIAIDLSRNTTGASIIQYERAPVEDVNGDDEIDDDDVADPSIYGDILLGSGDDTFRILGGQVSGNTDFGAGIAEFELNDALLAGNINFGGDQLSATFSAAEYEGDIDFGTGAGTLLVEASSLLTGNLTNSGFGLSATLADSEVVLLENTALQLASLDIFGTSVLDFEINPQALRSTPYISVLGTATLTGDTTFRPTLTSLVDNEFSVTLISAGSIFVEEETTGIEADSLPWIYDVALESGTGTTETLDLNFRLKTADELELDFNQASAYPAILTLAVSDEDIGSAISQLTTASSFEQAYNLLLPQRTNSATRYLESQTNSAFSALGEHLALSRTSSEAGNGAWIQESYSNVEFDGSTDGPGYNGRGLGIALGYDRPLFGLDAVGIMGSITDGKFEEKTGGQNPVTMKSLGIGAYATERLGPIDIQAAVQHALVDHTSYREIEFGDYRSEVSGSWDGRSTSASLLVSSSYGSEHLQITPHVGVDYFNLAQDSYRETASNGLNLWVSDAETDRTTASAGIGFAYVWRPRDKRPSIGSAAPSLQSSALSGPMVRVGVDAGYRSTLSSTPYEVRAGFVGYDETFLLQASDEFSDSAVVGVSMVAGAQLLKLRFGVGGEFSNDASTLTANASVKLRF